MKLSISITSLLLLAFISVVLSLVSYRATEKQERVLLDNEEEWAHRRISLAEDHEQWMTQDEIFDLHKKGIKFIDVTNEWQELDVLPSTLTSDMLAIPSKPAHKKRVKSLISNIDQAEMKNFLVAFSGFHTRYFRSNAGTLSAAWLYDQCTMLIEKADEAKVNLTVREFDHSWKQPSIIVRMEPANITNNEQHGILVLSAHQDSINQWSPFLGRSPGADDDGSGTTTIFEALRILVREGFVPIKPIEFHFYAAEEGGLLGSQAVVATYKKAGTPVLGVYHADMTGYPSKTPSIGLSTDYIDTGLMKFVKKLVEAYCDIPPIYTKCGYGCSDHASWTRAGYKAAFTFEGPFADHSPYIHTTNDDVSTVSFKHMAEFVKLAISFAVEMSHS
jgi:leucyl aminopeptidase